jgi:hypothetical protein
MINSTEKNQSVYTEIDMSAAGFKYTGDGDTTCCENCELKVSNWTLDMDPLTIHSQKKPDCPLIRSKIASSSLSTASERNTVTSTNLELLRLNEMVFTATYDPTYAKLPKRRA